MRAAIIGERALVRGVPDDWDTWRVPSRHPRKMPPHFGEATASVRELPDAARLPSFGCFLAHRTVWEAMHLETQHGYWRPTVILEDDCTFEAPRLPGDPERIGISWPDADFVYFGGQPIGWEPRDGHGVLGRWRELRDGEEYGRTHAYAILTTRALARLLRIMPMTSWSQLTHWREGLDVRYAWPPLAGQAANHSDITGFESPERWWYEPFDEAVRDAVRLAGPHDPNHE